MNDGERPRDMAAVEGGAARAKTMLAAVMVAPRDVEVRETPRREPGPGEVLVFVEGCGLCASSIPVWEGRPWFRYPLPPGAPGHEGWGTIADCGPGVPEEAAGSRVCFLSDQALAEEAIVPFGHTVRIPSSLRGLPFPGEPLACAVNAFRRARVCGGESVAVIGVGFLGAVLVQLAAAAGAQVTAMSRRPFSLELARGCGAAAVFPLELSAVSEALDLTEGCGFDVVVEAAGFQSTLDCATALSKEGGRLVIAGYHQDGTRQVDLQTWNWRALEVINAHQRRPEEYLDGMRAGIDAVESRRLDPFPLFTHHFTLDRLGEAFDMLIRRPDGFVKALVLS